MIRIGRDKHPVIDEKSKEPLKNSYGKVIKRTVSYMDVYDGLKKTDPKFDENSFVSVNYAVPIDFDLVDLKTSDDRIRAGWWTGGVFYCRKLKPHEHVKAWRHKHSHNLECIGWKKPTAL